MEDNPYPPPLSFLSIRSVHRSIGSVFNPNRHESKGISSTSFSFVSFLGIINKPFPVVSFVLSIFEIFAFFFSPPPRAAISINPTGIAVFFMRVNRGSGGGHRIFNC